MDKTKERANKDKILRRLAQSLKPLGFHRTKPTYYCRVAGPIVEFVHIHKYSFGPSFRAHACLRVMNDPRDFIALLGITSDDFGQAGNPEQKQYVFSYTESDDALETCVDNMRRFVVDAAEPWFASWRDLDLLLTHRDSPLPDEERLALRAALNKEMNPEFERQTQALLKL